MSYYKIDMKIGDEEFNKLLSSYKVSSQGKKNTITSLKKLVNRSSKDIFYVKCSDAQIFYDSCINDINNGTYKPLYVRNMLKLLKAFYEYINDLSKKWQNRS